MQPINCRITLRDRTYLDGEIKKGRFASYGHALRALLHYYKVMSRENAKLRSENARMKGIMEVMQNGQVGQETQPSYMGTSKDPKTY